MVATLCQRAVGSAESGGTSGSNSGDGSAAFAKGPALVAGTVISCSCNHQHIETGSHVHTGTNSHLHAQCCSPPMNRGVPSLT